MYAGRIVELAAAGQLIEEARHPYTRALLAAVPEPDPANRLRQRPIVGGEPPDAGNLPGGCAFEPRCPVAISGTCERVVPPLISLADGHQVACHHYPAADSSGSVDDSAAGAADAAATRSASMTSSAASRKGSSDSG